MAKKIVELEGDNGVTLKFEVDGAMFNQFLNELDPRDKIASYWNLLSRTVMEESRGDLKKFTLDEDGVPYGLTVIQIGEELGKMVKGDVEFKLKKPSKLPTPSTKTA